MDERKEYKKHNVCVYKEIDEGGGGSRYLRKDF